MKSPNASAQAEPRAYVVIDSGSGRIFDQKNFDKKLQIGSLTKIATALIALDWSENGQHPLDQVIRVPQQALTTAGPSAIGLQANDQISLRDLLYAALLQSDNVAAQTLAYHVGAQLLHLSSESNSNLRRVSDPSVAFVAQMNALANTLGMRQTRFLNPTGIDNKEKPFSTAGDIARLARHAMKKASFRFYVAQKERKIEMIRNGQPSSYMLHNTNELLGINRIDGVKTGQTAVAGSCLVASSEREPLVRMVSDTESEITQRRLIVVILGANDRFRIALNLINKSQAAYDDWMAHGHPFDAKQSLF